mgnify:CR=1 FL=1
MNHRSGEPDVGELRRRLREQRRGLDLDAQRRRADAVAARGFGVPEIAAARTVGTYLPDDGEVDPTPLTEKLDQRGAALHLPVVGGDDLLRFRSWDLRSALVEGRWGIAVPDEPSETRSTDELDVVIVPLVAADPRGTRIGRGVGYYDRALAHRLELDGRPLIVGYAHHFQLVDATLPRQPWDVPLDVLVTEQRVLRFTDGDSGSGPVRVP